MPGRFTILLVDDDPSIADVLNRAGRSSFPEATFFHVDSFSEAVSYLDNLEGRGPKLILLDIDLRTGIDGLGFLRLIRNHPQGRLIPIIVLSATEELNQIDEAYEQGATSFIRKPFTYDEWKEYVKTLRLYWFETSTVPKLWFEKDADTDNPLTTK